MIILQRVSTKNLLADTDACVSAAVTGATLKSAAEAAFFDSPSLPLRKGEAFGLGVLRQRLNTWSLRYCRQLKSILSTF